MLGAEAAELVETVDVVELSQEFGQLGLADELGLRIDQLHTRYPKNVDDPGRDLTADLSVASGAGEEETGLNLVEP